MLVATKYAPFSRTARGSAVEVVEIEVAVEADDDGLDRLFSDRFQPARSQCLDHARARLASTRVPGRRTSWPGGNAAAIALVSTSSG